MPLSARTRMLAALSFSSAARRSRTAFVTSSSFVSSALRFAPGPLSSVLRADFTPAMPFVISSAAVRSSPEATLPRRVTTPCCVSTLICRALTRLSVTSAIFVLEVIQDEDGAGDGQAGQGPADQGGDAAGRRHPAGQGRLG